MRATSTVSIPQPAPAPHFRTVPNAAIARTLSEIADALEIEGENPFRVRAYRNAALCLETLGTGVVHRLERS